MRVLVGSALAKYFDSVACPYCGSEDLDLENREGWDGTERTDMFVCGKCGTVWSELWKLVEVAILEGPMAGDVFGNTKEVAQ